jgi:hypothetical protein
MSKLKIALLTGAAVLGAAVLYGIPYALLSNNTAPEVSTDGNGDAKANDDVSRVLRLSLASTRLRRSS